MAVVRRLTGTYGTGRMGSVSGISVWLFTHPPHKGEWQLPDAIFYFKLWAVDMLPECWFSI